MFNAATNFVIQNGVFIEMKDNAKLYAKKLLNPARDIQLSNYRRIRRGDIHLQEQIWNVEVHGRIGNVWDEYVVEVSAESKSKVARIYQGRDAYALFKRELEVLSKLWPHPRIRQIFGVYESNDVFGFVYHDDGMRRRYNEYVLHLNTLQRVAFSIKYTSDYIDTISYLERQVNRQMRYYTLQGELHDTLSHTAPNCIYFMDIYVDAYGRLSTVLSIREPSPVHYGIDYEGTASAVSWDRQRITQLSKGNLELIWPLLNNSRVDLQLRHEKKRLISAWNSALLSVKKKISFAMKYNAEYLLGHPVVLWFSGPELDIVNDVLYISGCSGDMFKRDVKPQTSWRIVEDIFHSHVVRVREFTRFHLRKENLISMATKNVGHLMRSLSGRCKISDDLYYSWLSQAFEVLKNSGLRNHNAEVNIGIVSHISMTVEIDILLQPLMRYLKRNPNSEIYLFISNPKVYEANGGVSLLDAYWSLDNSGVETLSEFSASSIGLPVVRMPLVISSHISYWDKYYYESLPEFYNACGVTSSDVWTLLGLSDVKPRKSAKISQSSLYMEDLDVSYLAIKQKKKRNIPVEEAVIPDKHYLKRDITSLSWIGISNLEDCYRIHYSMYARTILQRKNIKYLLKMYADMKLGFSDENSPYPVDIDDGYIDIL